MIWLCTKCGYTHDAAEPPMFCPICQAPQDDFVENNELNKEKYAHLTADTE